MHFSTLFPAITLLALSLAAPTNQIKRVASKSCPSYTLLDVRGTEEPQAPSIGFITINQNVQAAFSGGKVYSAVYPASLDQNSTLGTIDIINHITSTLITSPNECFILEGHSQGAQTVVNALGQLTGAKFDAVKGVLLLGNPVHKPGLACNVDNFGGLSTRFGVGIFSINSAGIPKNWVSKTRDVCISDDTICDSIGKSAGVIHLLYPKDPATQLLGTSYIKGILST